MLLNEFKVKVENLLNSQDIEFKVHKGDEGGQWYSVELKVGLFEVYIASDCEVGINLPSEDDSMSFGGCDEVYDDLNVALERVRNVIGNN
ncbi:MAG: hypothetical protein ACRBHB_15790 [Arenicella sp.]